MRQFSNSMSRAISACGVIVLLSGCSFGPKFDPKIQMIAVEPPEGHKLPTSNGYPTGTVISADGSEIKIPMGASARVWFKLQLSGWGPEGLSGYDATVNYNCPHPPCDCLLGIDSTACLTSSSCFEGAVCNTASKCNSASIKNDSTYIFSGMYYTPTVTSAHPNHSWNAQLTSGKRKDPEMWVTSGTLMFFFADACPGATDSFVNFNFAEFKLGDGTRVTPFTKSLKVICY
jgi:hypothetical protein